jgi:hypothetical protein
VIALALLRIDLDRKGQVNAADQPWHRGIVPWPTRRPMQRISFEGLGIGR